MGKIKTFFKKISDYFFDNKNKFEIIFIVSIAYILIYEIETVRNFICDILNEYNILLKRYDIMINISKQTIRNIYFIGQRISVYYLIIYIVGKSFYFLYRKYYVKYGKLKKEISYKDDIFQRELFEYLNDKDSKNCFLITGEWGSGKTYCVKEFFNNYKKHFKFLNTKVYNISCFGITTRESIIKEVNSVILAENDNGYNSFLTIIKHIPIVGEFLADLLKVSYSIDNISSNSIFIFDDFERISYLDKVDINKNLIPPEFKTDLERNMRKRFDLIYERINNREEEKNNILVNLYLQKYNAVVGFINDIVENKKCKVIIVCNGEKLGYEYFNQIFDEKLNCKIYYKNFSLNSLKSLIENIKDNQIMETDRKNIIDNFFDEEYNIINEFWKRSFNKNLRLFDNFLREFFQMISQLDNNYLENKVFIKSMFYTYLIKKYLVNKNNYKYIKNIPTGGNVFFWFNLYKIDTNIKRSEFGGNLCWIRIKNDSFIINNEMAKEIINSLKRYQYYDIEDKLFLGEKIDSINSKDFLLYHILFSLWNNNEDINNISSETVCKLNIENYNIKKDNVSCLDQILNSLEYTLKNIDTAKRDSLYRLLYRKLKVRELEVEGIRELFRYEYNRFVKVLEDNSKKEG